MPDTYKLSFWFILLNILDLFLTLSIVGGGHGYELNPIMRNVLTLPLPTILVFKVGGSLVAVAYLGLLPAKFERLRLSVLTMLVGFMAGVVLFNTVGVVL